MYVHTPRARAWRDEPLPYPLAEAGLPQKPQQPSRTPPRPVYWAKKPLNLPNRRRGLALQERGNALWMAIMHDNSHTLVWQKADGILTVPVLRRWLQTGF